MQPIIKTVLYGLSVFAIYAIFVLVLRQVTNHVPTQDDYLGLFSIKDILLGLLLAVVLTFTHIRKQKLK